VFTPYAKEMDAFAATSATVCNVNAPTSICALSRLYVTAKLN
jgi:hypothetical protein